MYDVNWKYSYNNQKYYFLETKNVKYEYILITYYLLIGIDWLCLHCIALDIAIQVDFEDEHF